MILQTRGIGKTYAGVQANADVDFDLPSGQTRAIIGPNGAGKSTFVGIVCGRIRASSGTVIFDGVDISNLPAHERIRRGMAYTFQITSVFPGLSVRENIALGVRRSHGRDKAAVRRKTDEILERFAISGRAGQLASNLSYGHQRILEIGMGLAQNPRLFILDEPTQGLAEAEIENFKKLITSLDAETTILLIEHNMNVVMAVADYITVLDQGKVLANGSPEQIRTNQAVQDAYLGK